MDACPRSASSWVSGLWQTLREMIPGAGESTEGKGGAEDKCFASAPRGHPHAYKGNTRYPSPRAVRVPAPCSRAHDGAGGTAAPKPGRPETGSCHQGEEKHRGTFPFLFGTDNTHLRVSRSWWMRRQKSWGFSVLKGARDEKRIAPASTYPFPSQGRECGLHPWGGGRTDSRELGATARGVCKTVEGGGWPLPSRRGERKGGSVGGGLEVEGRRAAHRYVRSLIIVINCKYCPCLNLAKKERMWICQPRTACKRAQMKVGRRARDGKIRPGANSNPAADASPAPRPDQPSRPEFRGKGAADLPKPPAPCTPTAPRPPLPGWPPRTSTEAQPRTPAPTGGPLAPETRTQTVPNILNPPRSTSRYPPPKTTLSKGWRSSKASH